MKTDNILLIAGLLSYQVFISKDFIRNILKIPVDKPAFNNSYHIYSRLSGALLLGLVTYAIEGARPLKDFNAFLSWSKYFPFLAVASLLILGLMFILFSNEKNREGYPQFQFSRWNTGVTLLNISTWGVYLFSYEWLWRGCMIRLLSTEFSTTVAILGSTISYSLYHLFKSKREATGAIPMGLFLGLLSIHSNGFIPAFLLHWLFACSSEAICLYYNRTLHKTTVIS